MGGFFGYFHKPEYRGVYACDKSSPAMKNNRPMKKRMILSPIGIPGTKIDVRIEPAPVSTEAAVPDTSGSPAMVLFPSEGCCGIQSGLFFTP